jgi:nucleotide-binding universal stress UspA family protein
MGPDACTSGNSSGFTIDAFGREYYLAKYGALERVPNRRGGTPMATEQRTGSEIAENGQRIVVGVDGSERSLKALEYAAAEADLRGAVLDIHTAYEPGYEFITSEEVQRAMDREIAAAVARVAEVAPGVATTSETHEESPANALIEASDGAALLVVGSRGLGGFKGLLLGSVSQKCSLHSRCQVTIVR